MPEHVRLPPGVVSQARLGRDSVVEHFLNAFVPFSETQIYLSLSKAKTKLLNNSDYFFTASTQCLYSFKSLPVSGQQLRMNTVEHNV